MEKFDLVVVGSGVGLTILNEAMSAGMRCALIENEKIGGTCLTRGCIPSKMLVYPADLIKEAQHGKKVGLNLKLEGFDWNKISERMWDTIDESKGIDIGLSSVPESMLKIFKGTGEFTGKYTMKVKLNDGSGYSDEFEGKKFVLASGSRPIVLDLEGLDEVGVITSKSFFTDKFPKKPWKSLIILGGGIVACEFAHIFSSFGTQITMVKRSHRLVKSEEPEISESLAKQFKEYMNLMFGFKPIKISKKDGLKVVTLRHIESDETIEISAEEVLMAVGRRSNADLLKVENAGIETDSKGWIKTNKYLETNIENIWAIGDANGKFMFRHKANHDAEVCANNLLAPPEFKKPVDYSAVPWAIFTYPQIAHVGMTEQEAIDKGYEIYRAINHFSDVAKGSAMGFEANAIGDGFVKLIVDKGYRILGAHAIGPHAALLVQQFVYLMNSGFSCPKDYKTPMGNIPKNERACPEAGTFFPLYRSMVMHPSLNEVSGWILGKLQPVNIKEDKGHGHNHGHDHESDGKDNHENHDHDHKHGDHNGDDHEHEGQKHKKHKHKK